VKMKNKTKYRTTPNDLILTVVSSATVASEAVANGRNVPVVFVKSDENHKIDEIVKIHRNIKDGNCQFVWGTTEDNKYVLLRVDFENPVQQRVAIMFDIIKYGFFVDHILYAQCFWLMVGDEGCKLSDRMDQDRIFMEIPCDEFKLIWQPLFRTIFSKHLKAKHGFSMKTAYEIFDNMSKELEVLKKLRM